MNMKFKSIALGITLTLAGAMTAHAAVVDFESTGLSDNDAISSISVTEGTLSFSLTTNGSTTLPHLEQVGQGDSVSGFNNGTAGAYDVENSGDLGNFFLRGVDDIRTTGKPFILTITYDFDVFGASGEIWDIDSNPYGTEQWEVKAFDASGTNELDSDLSPVYPIGANLATNSHDGKPWLFSVESSTAIRKLTLEFVGTKDETLGLAFDNFNYDSAAVPSPEGIVAGLGVIGTLAVSRIRRRRKINWR